jgi:hypothetical protein
MVEEIEAANRLSLRRAAESRAEPTELRSV